MKILSMIMSFFAVLIFCLTGTDVTVTDVEQYGEVNEIVDFPEFFPESVAEYNVNDYCYSEVYYFDPCYELFLDITVTREQFDSLISEAKADESLFYEKQAYYADGYYEIVFDDYSSDSEESPEKGSQEYDTYYIDGFTDIRKIVYNPDTLNIVFECLYLRDAYDLNRIEYLNRFDIDWNEYRIYMDDIPCSDSCEARNCKTYSLVKYDFIEYNGTVYYRTDEKVDKLKDKARPIDVYLLEYDKKHHNECLYTAYPFMNDPDMIYIIFEDRIYTKDSDLASDYYTSYDFLKKFKKDEVRISE